MLNIVLYLALSVSSVNSIEPRPCTGSDFLDIWTTFWASHHAGRQATFGKEVFKRVFDIAPEAEALFSKVNANDPESPQFRAHCMRVLNGLDVLFIMANRDNLDVLEEQLEYFAKQHTKYEGLKRSMFDVFVKASVDVLSQALTSFNSKEWTECIDTLNNGVTRHLTE